MLWHPVQCLGSKASRNACPLSPGTVKPHVDSMHIGNPVEIEWTLLIFVS